MARKKSKMGRPPRHEGERLSKSRTFRVRPHLDGSLQKAAAEAGRSVSEEIEHRLDQSFQRAHEADLIADALRAAHGGRTGDLLSAIATVVWLIERRTGKKWNEDRDTAFDVREAVEAVAEALVIPRSLTPERVVDLFGPWGDDLERHRKSDRGRWFYDYVQARRAALEALQKMGMAPSDAEIAGATKKSRREIFEAVYGKEEAEKK